MNTVLVLADINAVGYVVAGWVVTALGLGGFAVATIRRERRLHEQVPPEERRWS